MKKNNQNLTLKVISVAILSLGSLLLSANSLKGGGPEETQKLIKEHVKFPKFLLPFNKTEKVEVIFTTAENGKINFILVKTENKIIKNEIEKQLQQLTLNKLKANVAHSIIFNFKTI